MAPKACKELQTTQCNIDFPDFKLDYNLSVETSLAGCRRVCHFEDIVVSLPSYGKEKWICRVR